MVEITLKEALDVLRQIDASPETSSEKRMTMLARQYLIIFHLIAQKLNDHDRAFQTLFDRNRGDA